MISTAFNNPTTVARSWYVAAKSRELRAGDVKSYNLLGRRIALYRDPEGLAHAIDARCPHLGADLGQGRVIGDAVQCAFHGWRVGADGHCSAADSTGTAARTRVYPVAERWGLIWIFNGPQVLFALPDAPPNERLSAWRLPPQRINCHPHLVIANGLDVAHYEVLHGMIHATPPHLTVPAAHKLSLTLRGKPGARWQQMLTGTRRTDLAASFTTIGSSLAWATVESPLRFHMLFAARPGAHGSAETQTVLWVPKGSVRSFLRALALMYVLLYEDHRILDSLQFTPNFTAHDAPLKAFADLVNGLGTW